MVLDTRLVLALFSTLIVLAASTLALLIAFLTWARSSLRAETTRLLDALTRQERKIEALLSRLDARGDPARVPPGAGTTDEATKTADGDRPDPSPHRKDPAGTRGVGKPTLIAVPSLAVAAAEASSSASVDLALRFGAVWERADAGEPAETIARALGQPIGQVELILGLRRQMAGPTEVRPPASPTGPSEPRR